MDYTWHVQLRLFLAAIYQIGGGISPKEVRKLQIQLRERLQNIWDATDPKLWPLVFDDFRQSVIEQFLQRLEKEDPRLRRAEVLKRCHL